MNVEVTVFTKCSLLDAGFSSFLPFMLSLPKQPQRVLFSTVVTLGTQIHLSINAEKDIRACRR